MKNIQIAMIFMALLGVFLTSAYDDRAMLWHDDMVPSNSFANFGKTWLTNEPDDINAHLKAQREKEYRQKQARRKYQDQQTKIQRKKEDRNRY
jgi:hypothetical protein